MLEAGTMLLFCAVLFASVALGWSIIPALFVGVLLFMGYGLVRRCSLRAMASRAAGSVRSAGTVVVAFVLIGVLTSLWRASGTIAFFVHTGLEWMHPSAFYLAAFLLASALSMAFGSSFGVAGTAGVILAAIARSGGASGIVAISRLLGQTLGASLVALCFHLSSGSGPHYALWLGCVFALVGAVASGLRLLPYGKKA